MTAYHDGQHDERTAVTADALMIEGLARSFVGPDGSRTPVVDIPGFAIAACDQVALHGVSGSGKTTFLHLIAGILTADRGRILIGDREMTALREPDRDRLRAERIGYVFQTGNLLQGFSALENVLLAMHFAGRGRRRNEPGGGGTERHADQSFAEHLLARVGLTSRFDHRPAQLSAGQQQRVAVARALANRPLLVLADEPTGSLDPDLAVSTLALIREVCHENEAALLLVSHDPLILDHFAACFRFGELNRAVVGTDSTGAENPAGAPSTERPT
jgi:ABC-type lipoprotein export system ATPase subunit